MNFKLHWDIRYFLCHPLIYNSLQKMTGSDRINHIIVREYIRPQKGQTIIDIGCGTCNILKILPGIRYLGIDNNPLYISAAKKKFGEQGIFCVMDINNLSRERIHFCDTIISLGVMHHLSDDEVLILLQYAKDHLNPNGRFVSFDPCFKKGQNIFARAIHAFDRGNHVRYVEPFIELVKTVFPNCQYVVRNDLFYVPTTVIIFECTR